jgi:Lrp/AsnC family transcriptional regulator, leucine-responsive regulatory protein
VVRAAAGSPDRAKRGHDRAWSCQDRAVDPTDRAIVLALQRNARINFRELAAEVNLSPNATADRVRRLERAGVIKGYTAILDPIAAGRNLTAIIDVKLKHGTPPEGFEPVVRSLDTVVDAAHVTGTYDYQLRVAVANASELDAVIRLLKARANVVETATRIILRSVVSRATTPASAQPID